MSKTLTSWKEIAQYVGKGIRTVQRWESAMGLPIRRHSDRPKGMVLAFTEEIDAWMRSETIMMRSSSESDVARLRKRLIEVMFENTTLRAEVDRLQKTPIQLVSTVGSDPALATKPSATALSESNPPN